MRVKFETLLSTLTSLGAIAYALGWLKSFYFYRTMGVSLDLADLSVQEYLFESWFVLENVAFFLLLWWVVLARPAWWAVVVAVLYSLLPIGAHYAFGVPDWPLAPQLIAYRHTLLKFVPFVVLAVALLDRGARSRLRSVTWQHGTGGLVLLAVITIAWSISTAKHFGSFDALQALERPDAYLTRVTPRPGESLEGWDPSRRLYLLRATDDAFILLDLTTFDGRPGSNLGIVVVPRDSLRWLDGVARFQHQIGGRYL